MKTCINCGGPIVSKRQDAAVRYCGKIECQRERDRARNKIRRRPKPKYCRFCSADITGKLQDWCDSPECQEERLRTSRARAREYQASYDRKERRRWHRSKVSWDPPRICEVCGQEIFQVYRDGIRIFAGRKHCQGCEKTWERQSKIFNMDFMFAG